jgi:hypothetical protein
VKSLNVITSARLIDPSSHLSDFVTTRLSFDSFESEMNQRKSSGIDLHGGDALTIISRSGWEGKKLLTSIFN